MPKPNKCETWEKKKTNDHFTKNNKHRRYII